MIVLRLLSVAVCLCVAPGARVDDELKGNQTASRSVCVLECSIEDATTVAKTFFRLVSEERARVIHLSIDTQTENSSNNSFCNNSTVRKSTQFNPTSATDEREPYLPLSSYFIGNLFFLSPVQSRWRMATSFPGSFISRPPPPKKDPGSGWSRASQNLGGCQNKNWGRGGWVENSLNRVYSGAETFDVKINISLMWRSTKSDSTWEGKCLTLWPLKKFMLPIRSQVAAGFVVLWEITAKIYSGKQIEHFFEQRKSCAAVRCHKGKTSRTWYADHAKDASTRLPDSIQDLVLHDPVWSWSGQDCSVFSANLWYCDVQEMSWIESSAETEHSVAVRRKCK